MYCIPNVQEYWMEGQQAYLEGNYVVCVRVEKPQNHLISVLVVKKISEKFALGILQLL